MGRLTWGDVGKRFFEVGVDRGVLYVDDQPGVAWDGLMSVSESTSGGDAEGYYYDGVKYLNISSSEEFGVTIEAFAYPNEFAKCDGTALAFAGVSVGQQRRKSFGLSYRTKIGNDTENTEYGYKIHLVYNCLAAPSARSYSSMDDNTDPMNFSWDCTTKQVAVGNGLFPTAHITVDSRQIPAQALQILEDRLYGTLVEQSYLPSPAELFELFTLNPGGVFAIQRNTVTGISDLSPAIPGDLSTTLTAGIFVLTADSHLTGGSVDGIYEWEA